MPVTFTRILKYGGKTQVDGMTELVVVAAAYVGDALYDALPDDAGRVGIDTGTGGVYGIIASVTVVHWEPL